MFPKQFERIPFYVKMRDFLYQRYRKFIMVYFPQKQAEYLYKQSFGKFIDWKHPRDLNEWINYFSFKTDTTIWTKLADKYKVREYVKEKGLENILIPLLGHWKSVEDIDFDSLPNSFVIKCNNGSGDAIIVQDKNQISFNNITNTLNQSLNRKFGLESAEPHYLRIKPCIIAEEYLPSTEISVIDYKVWCFNGDPYCIFTGSNRNHERHTVDFNVFDLEWNRMNVYMTERYKNDIFVPKPKHLEDMLKYAKKLSDGFPQVRVDFYEVNEKVYFGEMTFTSQCGRMDYFTPEFLKIMGQKVNLQSA